MCADFLLAGMEPTLDPTTADDVPLVPLPSASAILKSKDPIRRLAKDVVDRIAAGEIIHQPSSALKEMLENSVDAGATSISVTCKSGGVKLLQVTDNGKGIRKEDMGIVCERHTTSKIKSFEDLDTVSTYGFRGEALASISMVARVSIITKTADEDCAYRAEYCDGLPVAQTPGGPTEPQPCAGLKGTTIAVRDLFYNVPTRLRTLKSHNEEYRQVLNVVSRYAVHYGDAGVGFTCKSHGKSVSDVHTSSKGASTLDNIRAIYGNKIGRELLRFDASAASKDDTYGHMFKAHGYISNANWSNKSGTFILFINHRLVDHAPLKRAINSVYSEYLPRHGKPFVYLSIEIPPQEVDVNVHPTKKEVIFSYSDEIVGEICMALREKLLGGNQSRVFRAQPFLAAPDLPASITTAAHQANTPSSSKLTGPKDDSNFAVSLEAFARKKRPAYEGNLHESALKKPKDGGGSQSSFSVDSKGRTVVSLSTAKPKSKPAAPYDPRRLNRTDASNPSGRLEPFFMGTSTSTAAGTTHAAKDSSVKCAPDSSTDSSVRAPEGTANKKRTYPKSSSRPEGEDDPADLTSVVNMCEDVKLDCHPGLVAVLRKHVFVGVVDDEYSLLQYQTKLFMINHADLADELFYQSAVLNFGHFYLINLPNKPTISHLLELGMSLSETGGSVGGGVVLPSQDESLSLEGKVEKAMAVLTDPRRRNMLADYFSITINDDMSLTSLPDLLPGYTPRPEGLPGFVVRLATKVDFTNEQTCFEDIAQSLAWYFSLLPFYEKGDEENKPGSLRWFIQHQLLPSTRTRFYPRREFSTDGTVLQVAALENLYKIFERC